VKNFFCLPYIRSLKKQQDLEVKKRQAPPSPLPKVVIAASTRVHAKKSRLDYSGSHHSVKILIIFTDQYRKKSQILVLFVCLVLYMNTHTNIRALRKCRGNGKLGREMGIEYADTGDHIRNIIICCSKQKSVVRQRRCVEPRKKGVKTSLNTTDKDYNSSQIF
jgi:hypothetical protein